MGKRLSALALAVAAAFAWGWPAAAPVHAADGDIKVEIAGKPQLSFDHEPVIEQGTTLVQFRPIFEAMGLTVGWDQDTHKVTGDRRGVHIELTLDSLTATVNGETKTLEQAPRLIDGHTFVPLRFVGEASEYEVDWKDVSREVLLLPTSATKALDIINDSSLTFIASDGSTGQTVWDGTGRLVNAAGQTVYEGDFRGGALEGQGTLQVNNIPVYSGGWSNDRFSGSGKLYRDDGKLEYEGGFVKGKKQGFGKQYNQDGKLIYEGDYAADKMNGSGTFYDADTGAIDYQGQVKDGKANGEGKQYYSSGKVYYEGEFKDGMKDGNGKLYDEDGNLVYDGPFKDDKQVNSFASFVTDRISKLHDWKKIETKYLTLYYYSDDQVVQTSAQKLDAIVDNVRQKLGQHLPKMEPGANKIPVYIMTPEDFKKDLNMPYDTIVGQWYDTTMFLSLRLENNSMYRFFQHEITHATTIGSVDRKAENIPVWFSEGTALYHEFDPPYTYNDNSREDAMRYVVRKNKLIPWDSIAGIDNTSASEEKLQISYAQSWSIYDYLARKYGEANIADIYFEAGDFSDLLEKATGKTLRELEADWVKYVKSKYR